MRVLEPAAWVRVGAVPVLCEVALTSAEQARGLQGVAPLAHGQGMLFPFHPPRAASFWMGTVGFPIDLLFADAAGKVARVVHEAAPGSRAKWAHPVVGAVVEVAGGFLARAGIGLGDTMLVAGQKLGARTYAMLRAGAIREMDVDLPTLIAQVMRGAETVGLPWEPTVLNPGRDRAVITPKIVGQWLHEMNVGEGDVSVVHDAATSHEGLEALATALISEGMADDVHVVPVGDVNVLVVTRRRAA